MKRAAIFLIWACCLTSCAQKDTIRTNVWRRTVEPRIAGQREYATCTATSAAGRLLNDVRCAEPKPLNDECPPIDSRETAELALTSSRQCTDAAIGALQRFGRTDAAAKVDLAAAWFVRAQRNDSAADLLTALDAAEDAVTDVSSPAAFFNRALILEALGLVDDALDDWRKADDGSAWGAEARAHAQRLAQRHATTMPSRDAFAAALRRDDVDTLVRFIGPLAARTLRSFETKQLAACAADPANKLRETRNFAEALARVLKDRYPIDAVDAIERASPAQRKALAEGHAALQLADVQPEAKEALSRRAAEILARGGSPVALAATIGVTDAASLTAPSSVTAAIQAVEKEAEARNYLHVLARARASHAHLLFSQSRYVESLDLNKKARATFEALGDADDNVLAGTAQATNFHMLGLAGDAWREALRAVRADSPLLGIPPRTRAYGAACEAALTLEHPGAALRYQQANVRVLERSGARSVEKAVAYRARAGVYARLENLDAAVRDLRTAMQLNQQQTQTIQRLVEARIAEIAAQTVVRRDPAAAVARYTEALALAGNDEYITFRADLLAQRAEAERIAGRDDDADADSAQALALLDREETQTLVRRKRGDDEQIWSAYFSRFRETYQSFVRHLAERGQPQAAFALAERQRGREPLDLVMARRDTPPQFRTVAAEIAKGNVAALQHELPAGTFVVEYSVQVDRTFAWIVSRDRFELLRLRPGREAVRRWTTTLQNDGRHNPAAFGGHALAPYQELLRDVLAAIAAMPYGAKLPRIVIVPDIELQGLPFVALRDAKQQKYFIELANASIAPSATLYAYSLMRDRAISSGSKALLVGDPAFDRNTAFTATMRRLPGAVREVREIAAFYPDNEPVIGDAATKSRFLERAAHFNVIHFGGHAFVDAQEPAASMLMLAPSRNDSGTLDAQTLISHFRADDARIVVLSACSSAGGAPVGPEGVAPLVRPFIAAGVPAVVGTLWDVGDAPTGALMVSFHRNYCRGADAASALRAAQLEMLGNSEPGLRSAVAWAPFQVIGYASSPFAAATNHKKEKEPP